jgi:ABC-2 type transport system ATP-binding protein
VIEVAQLEKSYGPVRALDGISFEVPEREVVGFLGPNGAGKSTTLRILTGFLPADAGTVRIAGNDVRTHPVAVRRSIGYLPEGVPLYPEMRVREFLRFRAVLKGIERRRRGEAIGRALEMAGVAHVQKRIVGTLSKGYRQRVGIADALLGQPPVLILDEPTVGLDPEQVIQFRQLLCEIGKDRTVLLSTHILSEVEIVCTGVIIIHQGKIAAQDSAVRLRQRVQHAAPLRVEIAGPPEQLQKALASLPEVEAVEDLGPASAGDDSGRAFSAFRLRARRGRDPRVAVAQLCRRSAWELRELHREEVTLEEAFLEVVGKR